MPVNYTDTKHTHNNPHTAPRACSIVLAERTVNALALPSTKGQQDCSPAPCCDAQKFSGISINWEFSRIALESAEHLCIYLSFLTNYYFFNAYEENRLKKYVYMKGGEYDKPIVQTRNVVALSPLMSCFQSENPSLSLLYPKYRLIYKHEHSVCQRPISCIGQFRTLNTSYISAVPPL